MNKKRVIYYGFTDNNRSLIVDYLHENHDWEPVLLVGHNAYLMHDWMVGKYKKCILRDAIKLRQAKFDYSDIGMPVPIDASIINSLSKYQLNYFASCPDTTGWNYSFEERKHFYHEMLKFWNTAVNNLEPDLIVFFTRPHTTACYSLYLLSKHHYDLDILFLDPIPFFDRNYHIVGSSLEQLYAPFIKLYKSNETIVPGKDVSIYLSELRKKEGKTPEYITDIYIKDKIKKVIYLKSFVRLVIDTLLCGKGFRRVTKEWKKNKKPYKLDASRMNYFENYLFLMQVRHKNKKLRKSYNRICVTPDFAKKYIYFAAPYQPEAVTLINAGAYEELYLVLDILSASCPDGWVIYYKEHPGTFLETRHGSLKRNKQFYEKVESYHNIHMIPSHISTFELIDYAQAVATVAGTAAWESVVRGKPALSFGNVWYQGCESIFSVNTIQDTKDAIKKIINGYTPDAEDVQRYAASIEKNAVKGMIHRGFNEEIKKCSNPKYELERISIALNDAYERHYSRSN